MNITHSPYSHPDINLNNEFKNDVDFNQLVLTYASDDTPNVLPNEFTSFFRNTSCAMHTSVYTIPQADTVLETNYKSADDNDDVFDVKINQSLSLNNFINTIFNKSFFYDNEDDDLF